MARATSSSEKVGERLGDEHTVRHDPTLASGGGCEATLSQPSPDFAAAAQ